VLATGGEDKKVNLWRIGQPHVLKVQHSAALNEQQCLVTAAAAAAICLMVGVRWHHTSAALHLCAALPATQSLTGLQSSVECVTFDATENQVAAGGANGTVKVWDLDSGKVSRSLTGHRSNCLTLEFHPIGPFLVTGSLDTNAKVWDLRRKECITTFKGHASGVCKLAVSPDGKWVASGSENGELKVRQE
jgi:WD40 repeat protein